MLAKKPNPTELIWQPKSDIAFLYCPIRAPLLSKNNLFPVYTDHCPNKGFLEVLRLNV